MTRDGAPAPVPRKLCVMQPGRSPTDDTSPGARAAELAVLRRMGPQGRLRAGMRFSGSMITLSRTALRSRHPGDDERTLSLRWIEQNYGADLARAVARRMGDPAWTTAPS